MDWATFIVGFSAGASLALVACTCIANREHRAAMTLLDRAIALHAMRAARNGKSRWQP